MVKENTSEVNSPREDRLVGPLLPFEELVKEAIGTDFRMQDKECARIASEDCTLPAPQALLHVTSRRKVPPRKRSLPTVNNCYILYLPLEFSFVFIDSAAGEQWLD